MSSYAIAASVVIAAALLWDCARRFFALQHLKLAEHAEIKRLDERIAESAVILNERAVKVEKVNRKALLLIKDEVAAHDKTIGEMDNKLSRLVSVSATASPRRMRMGGLGG